MPDTTFLFRLDGSRENDAFLALRRASYAERLYSGTPMKLGPGWIPDFVEVAIDDGTKTLLLTLIELEATESVARASCRKYLPEPSREVLTRFQQYLGTILLECQATADPRLGAFQRLRTAASRHGADGSSA
jgi:hypothetical protein